MRVKFKAATVLLKPAPKGSGIIAGGVVRPVLELSGVRNIVGKMLGGSNKITNVHATMRALAALRARDERGAPERAAQPPEPSA